MKILVVADLHLTNKNSKFKIGKNGVSDLLEAQKQFIEYIVEKHLKTQECDYFVFLGDYTDSEILDPITLNYAAYIMSLITNHCEGSIWLEGNHCIDDRGMVNTVMSGFKRLNVPDVHWVVTEPSVCKLDRVKFYAVPYSDDYAKSQETIERYNLSLNSDYINILLFHFPTTNALLDNSFPASRGLSLTDKEIGNFDLVLGGDYHKRQKLLNASSAYYVGAPFMFTFNEDRDKGYMIIEIKDDEISIEQHNNPFLYEMIKTDQNSFESLDLLDKSKSIVQVEDCDEENFSKFAGMRQDYYKLSLRKTSNKVKVEKTQRRKPLSLEEYVLQSDLEDKEGIIELVKEMALEA